MQSSRVKRPVLGAGTATSVGSLPHVDPVLAAEVALTMTPALPAAPQLPRRSPRESMVAQAAAGMAGVHVAADGSLYTDTRALAPVERGAALDGEAWLGARAFLHVAAGRTRVAKLQVAGPVTLGLALLRAGVPSPLAFTVAGAQVRTQADALLTAAESRFPDGVVLVLDEPGLTSVVSPSFPLPLDAAVDLLSGALAVVARRALAGVHCCGPTDWELVLHAGPDLVSCPVEYAPPAGALARFIERGGHVAWGAVPTDRPMGASAEPHWRRLSDLWCELTRGGCDPNRLRHQSLITPACGLGLHDERQVGGIFALVADLAERVQHQALVTRLSAGA